MSQLKHTPGPWSAYIGTTTVSICIGPKPTGKRPYIVDWPGFDTCDLPIVEQKANARLIAAAPELLDALQAFMGLDPIFTTSSDQHNDELIAEGGQAAPLAIAIKKARGAIKKATGGAA